MSYNRSFSESDFCRISPLRKAFLTLSTKVWTDFDQPLGKTLTQLLCLELILLLGFAYYWMLGKKSKQKPYGFLKFGAGEISMWLKTMIHKSGFQKNTSPFLHNQNPSQVFGWILNQKRPRNCMLPTASCTPATSLWYHPQAAPNKKTKTGDHQSEPEGKVWRWVRRAFVVVVVVVAVFFAFFLLGSGATTDTHVFWREKKWREQSAGEKGIWLLQWFGEKKRFPKKRMGFVVPDCCDCCDLPYFFLEVKDSHA